MWFYVHKMDVKERKNIINYIISLNKYKGSFIEYSAKFFMAELIDNSECYYNGSGYYTPVK